MRQQMCLSLSALRIRFSQSLLLRTHSNVPRALQSFHSSNSLGDRFSIISANPFQWRVMLHKPFLHTGVEKAMKRAVSWQITCFNGSHPANYHWDAGESFQKCSNDDLLYILLKLYSLARFDGLPLTVTYQHQFSFTTLTLFSVAACMFPFYFFRRETFLSSLHISQFSVYYELNKPNGITSCLNLKSTKKSSAGSGWKRAVCTLSRSAGTATCLTTPGTSGRGRVSERNVAQQLVKF